MPFTVLPDGAIKTDTAAEAVELALALLERKGEVERVASDAGEVLFRLREPPGRDLLPGLDLVESREAPAVVDEEPSLWKPNRPNGRGTVERSGRFGWRWSVMIKGKRHVGPTYGSRDEALDALETFIDTGVMPEKPPRAPYRCTLCHGDGHTKKRCPHEPKTTASLPPSKIRRNRQHRMGDVATGKIGPSGLPVWICLVCRHSRCAGNREGWLYQAPGKTEWTREPRWCPGPPGVGAGAVTKPVTTVEPAVVTKLAAVTKPAAVREPAAVTKPAAVRKAEPTTESKPEAAALVEEISEPTKAQRRKGPTPPRKVKARDLSIDVPISISVGDTFAVAEDFVEEETGIEWKAGERWTAVSPTGKTDDGYDEWEMSPQGGGSGVAGKRDGKRRTHPQLHPFFRAVEI